MLFRSLWGGQRGAAFYAGSGYNAVSLSTMIGSANIGLAFNASDSNTVTQCSLWGGVDGAYLSNGSDYNAISLSTAIGGSNSGHYSFGSDSNTVTLSYLSGGAYGAWLDSGADYNVISLSTMIGGSSFGLYVNAADANAVTQGYMRGGTYGVWMQNGSDRNTISLSTMIGAGQAGFYAGGSDSNTVTRSYMSGGLNGAQLTAGADFNTVSLSTMVSSSVGNAALYILQSSSNTILDSYVQGSTAALISGSTGTVIGGSIFVATGTAGSALAFAGGSVNLTIATSTLLAPSLGRGLALNPGNAGVVSIGSVTFTGAARGIEVSTQGALFSLAVDSITFRALAPGATAIHFLGGSFVATFTLANFEDASVAVNVSGAALALTSRLTMNAHYGLRTSPKYENDPNLLVDWRGAAPYPGCVLTHNVGLDQAYASITEAVADLPASLPGHTCVVIRDSATYPEQVTVRNFSNNGSSITFLSDPALLLRPVVAPPALSTAAFLIANASVNIQGISVVIGQEDRKSTRLNSSHIQKSRMPSSA